MSAKLLVYIMELMGIGGLISLLAYISWDKMVLGAALSLLGAFFPELNVRNNEQGEGTINAGKISLVFRGGLRFVVVVAGLVLIVGAILDGHEGFNKVQASEQVLPRELLIKEYKENRMKENKMKELEYLIEAIEADKL